jgi:DNA-binding response OmpR family regulator
MKQKLKISFVDDSADFCGALCDILSAVYENEVTCNQFSSKKDINAFPEWVKTHGTDLVFLDFVLFPSENGQSTQSIKIYKELLNLKKKPNIYWMTGLFDTDPRLQLLERYYSIKVLKKPISIDSLLTIIDTHLN